MPNQNIIQRRGGSGPGAGSSSALPITNQDVALQNGKNRKQNILVSPYNRTSLIRWVILIVTSMAIGQLIWIPILSLFGLTTQQAHISTSTSHSIRQLLQFTELSYALQNSDLMALYFAASWCPMSTPVSIDLDKVFGGNNDNILTTDSSRGRKTLSIVYISSDKTLEEYNTYLDGRNWLAVPFDSPEISQLKRHFSTCAHRELKEELGIDRKHEIPTLIVIDTQSQGIITTNGANDVDQLGEKALNHWIDMQKWIQETAAQTTS